MTGNLSPKDESTEEPLSAFLHTSPTITIMDLMLTSAAIKPPPWELQPKTQPEQLGTPPTAPAGCSTAWNSEQPTLSEPHTEDNQSSPAGFLHSSHNYHSPVAEVLAKSLPIIWTPLAGKENQKASTLGCWDIIVLTQSSRWLFFCSNGKF